MTNLAAPTRDIVVIGASAGGVEALRDLVRGLPSDLPAAVFVVLHIGRHSQLAGILGRAGPLPAAEAKDGEPIEHGRIYVAPPDLHLLVHGTHVLLRRGPRENLSRPAIDPLFRSAACALGPRVIGVVLTGALGDGTAGLRAIKRCGGLAVVQDPSDAAVPSMPENALHHVAVDHCVPIARMAALLVQLVGSPAGDTPVVPRDIQMEAAIALQESSTMEKQDLLGEPAPFSCPECQGPLWQIEDGDALRFRCHIGHALSSEAMQAAQGEDIENTLWRLFRTHRERAELARRLAAKEPPQSVQADRYNTRAEGYAEDAAIIHRFILGRTDMQDPF